MAVGHKVLGKYTKQARISSGLNEFNRQRNRVSNRLVFTVRIMLAVFVVLNVSIFIGVMI